MSETPRGVVQALDHSHDLPSTRTSISQLGIHKQPLGPRQWLEIVPGDGLQTNWRLAMEQALKQPVEVI